MTDTQPIPSLIPVGDYIVRGDRVLAVLDVIGEGDRRAYDVARVSGATVERTPNGLGVRLPAELRGLGRGGTILVATAARDSRYTHVPASLVVREEPDPKPEPANEIRPQDLSPPTIEDRLVFLENALDRTTKALENLTAAIERASVTKGQLPLRLASNDAGPR